MKIRAFVLLIISVLSLNTARAADAPPPPTAPPQVRGNCTIELKIGVKQYLANMGIAVVPADRGKEITRVRNDQWRLRASRANYSDGFHNLDLESIGGTAVRLATLTVKTDAEGRYEIRDLADGDYLLYAQYQSRYAIAYWLVPLTVKAGAAPLTVDINNNNMKEVYNIKKAQW